MTSILFHLIASNVLAGMFGIAVLTEKPAIKPLKPVNIEHNGYLIVIPTVKN